MPNKKKYVIVTSNALKNSLSRLIDQKKSRGYQVEVRTVEEIDDLYPDKHRHDAIRSFVLSEKNSAAAESCLLLAGDKTSIPGYPILSVQDARYYCFGRGRDNKSYFVRYFYTSGWNSGGQLQSWEDKSGVLDSDLVSVSNVPGLIDVFARNSSNELIHMHDLGEWKSRGGQIASAPSAITRGIKKIDVFARGTDDSLKYLYFNGANWSDWQDLGGSFTGEPVAVSTDNVSIHVFVRMKDDQLGIIRFDGTHWHACESLGGSINSKPAVVHRKRKHFDIMARGTDNKLKHITYINNAAGNWHDLGSQLSSAPAAVSWGRERVDVFAKGAGSELQHIVMNNGAWGAWENLGGAIDSIPVPLAWEEGKLDVFARKAGAQKVVHIKFNANRWTGWDERDGDFTGNLSICERRVFDSDPALSMASMNEITAWFYTGRLSTEDAATMSSICDLLVEYPRDNSAEWRSRTVLTGWIPRGYEAPVASRDADPGWQCVKEIGDYFEIDKQFEKDPAPANAARVALWGANDSTRQSLKAAIEKGALVVRYSGHGTTKGWANIGDKEDFSNNDVLALNLGNKTPLVISSTCLTGDIESSQGFAETWQSNCKAIGIIASDDPTRTCFMDTFPQRIYRNMIKNRIHCIGKIFQDAIKLSHDELPDDYVDNTAKMLRYFGDPDTIVPITRSRTETDSVVAWESDRLDVFSKGPTGHLQHLWYDHKWRHWEDLGAALESEPECVAWDAGRLDIFARNSNNQLHHLWFDAERWGHWENKGGEVFSAPAAVSWGRGRLDIFAYNRVGNLMHLWYDVNGWGRWENLAGSFTGKPCAISRGYGKLDIFARGIDNKLHYLQYDERNGAWHPWADLGGSLTSDPSAAAWAGNRIDVVAKNNRNHLIHIWCNDPHWSNWEDKAGNISSAPAVISCAADSLLVIARSSRNQLAMLEYDHEWKPWRTSGSNFINQPCVASWRAGRYDVFIRDKDNHLMHTWKSDGNWRRWEDKTPNLRQEWI